MLSDLDIKKVPALCVWPVEIEPTQEDPDLYLIKFMGAGRQWTYSTRFLYMRDNEGNVHDIETPQQASIVVDRIVLLSLLGKGVTL